MQGSFWERTRGNGVPLIVEKLPERMGTEFPLLKCLRTRYGQQCEPFSGQKCTRLQDLYNFKKKFPGVIPTDPPQKRPGASTQTPISAWLASVPIVPGLRNDHRKCG